MLKRTILLVGFLILINSPASAQSGLEVTVSCNEDPAFRLLDFWLGDWDVFVQDRQAGTNRIVKILNGCAIHEFWTDARGQQGQGLVYYQNVTGLWKHIWVTENATERGGVKEKQQVAVMEDGSVQFQGTIPLQGGGSYLDRTTLTPFPDGRVRQLIEISTDGGTNWHAVFDGVYVKRKG